MTVAQDVTPADVLDMSSPTPGFLCSLKANVYGLDFLQFEVKDHTSGQTVFEPLQFPDLDPAIESAVRSVAYTFPASFLEAKMVETKLKFAVGDKEVPNFRMIERHYFKGTLVRSYDFTFGFCIPSTVNSWDSIYDVPPLSKTQIQEYIASPHAHQSDSFYFVDDKLIMHNKAFFAYV